MKIIIAGSRTFNDIYLLKNKCDNILANITSPIEIVSGTAQGADKLGEKYADIKGYKIKKFKPDWSRHGKAAGIFRNEKMGIYADALIAFWDGKSKGTKHMIDFAKKNNLKVRVINYGI